MKTDVRTRYTCCAIKQALLAALQNTMLERIRDEIIAHRPNTEELIRLMFQFLLAGASGLVEDWIQSGLRETPEKMAEYLSAYSRCLKNGGANEGSEWRNRLDS